MRHNIVTQCSWGIIVFGTTWEITLFTAYFRTREMASLWKVALQENSR
jgi:hypothetical protein